MSANSHFSNLGVQQENIAVSTVKPTSRLPEDSNRRSRHEQVEILNWVRTVIISGLTDYRKYQAAAIRQRYVVRHPCKRTMQEPSEMGVFAILADTGAKGGFPADPDRDPYLWAASWCVAKCRNIRALRRSRSPEAGTGSCHDHSRLGNCLSVAGPVVTLGCLSCLLLLFFETAFGICVGCKICNAIWPGQAQLSPSDVCEIHRVEPIQRIAPVQLAVVAWVAAIVAFAAPQLAGMPSPRMSGMGAQNVASDKDCSVPAFAIAIGQEEQCRLHQGCS